MRKIVLLVFLIALCSFLEVRVAEKRISSIGTDIFHMSYTNFIPKYLTWTQMENWLKKIRQSHNCYNKCKLYFMGNSHEKRNLWVMKIYAPGSLNIKKKIIWIDGGIHAAEWISHTTALYFISRFVNRYNTDAAIRNLLNKYHVYIMPCINPDGYEYSRTTYRYWRKNRRKPPGNTCVGTDINRNFNHNWKTIGASSNSCADNYAGPNAESEPETKAVAAYVTKLHKNLGGVLLFLTLHGYGQYFVSPWGYTSVKPSNYKKLMCVAKIAADKIKTVYGTIYKYGDTKTVLGGHNSGTSKDWAYGKLRIPYVFTVELRGPPGTGLSGFVLPEAEIMPNCREIWEGIMEMIDGIENKCTLKVSIPLRPPRVRVRWPIWTNPPFPPGPGPLQRRVG